MRCNSVSRLAEQVLMTLQRNLERHVEEIDRVGYTIVDGAIHIVRDAVQQLQQEGLEMSIESRDQLVSNLLVVICSGERPQPVVQVQSGKRA